MTRASTAKRSPTRTSSRSPTRTAAAGISAAHSLAEHAGSVRRAIDDAGAQLTDLARRLHPEGVVPDAHVKDAAVVLMLRPLTVDLLVGTGMPIDEARALLPEV